ncbi:MAG TPA: hypothetical protein IAB06_03110 [Candidatus Avacidaminococcus intestinavium]|uniref:Uncharacterized protein n=1 Tax=Candidatus Avacidaminococcus intestinavium TaxID=2840684 RepID=A0A9D1MPS5_9FIRM|nr:hypothetical protein [Candidatus Avacidaminococcus intestinavium]
MIDESAKQEPKELEEQDFLRIANDLREKIKKAENIKNEGKQNTLEVLDAVVRSVKAHGVSQHGLTKKKKRVALTVFERMSKAEEISQEEKAVLETLVYVTFQGIVQAK